MSERSLQEGIRRLAKELSAVDLALGEAGVDSHETRRESVEALAKESQRNHERAELLAEELERTKGNLAAMQRDRDALAAEVRDVDEALRDTGLEHHIPTGQGLNKDTRRLAIECSAACSEQLLERVETLLAVDRPLHEAAENVYDRLRGGHTVPILDVVALGEALEAAAAVDPAEGEE
jgi:hypothetical protein